MVGAGCDHLIVDGFDIIGDVHGCADQLESLLAKLGYRLVAGVYAHPARQAVFVGYLIDRGPQQLRVLRIVKSMVDSGTAQIVMGNHEFNAICFALPDPRADGEHLRPHNDKNRRQHQAFLAQVTGDERARYLEWFTCLPLWLDLGGIRVVHACWHEPSMKVVEQEFGSSRFGSEDQFVIASTKGEPLYEAVEVLLKGPEISLVQHAQPPYVDKDGHQRDSARLRWWNDRAVTLRDLAEIGSNFQGLDGRPYPSLPEIEVPADERSYVYTGDTPVFYGHYWRQGPPKLGIDWTARTACVDFSAVKGGSLMAYRWSGEPQLRAEHYLFA
ncbi:metallophosphoesterase [Mycolicibacterium wolinskyi]|uniref:Metallophosphatase n=1 Tax=Mycolicibacterium wolinskyi TaxID=59750 RepID=A0A1X2EZ26_9MYCO|nr:MULTISPECIES: metallophosphoesterase [Mycolicibacterium]MCV7288196.1 metallophosphoesterase [Mycolicibacterium wolinskyi]MCV7295418.1 metallophosphoesterase [Mycolicibacterium goodii]ORX11471.1 metallophosphatase [Mycolicibacterium wolinskyi]